MADLELKRTPDNRRVYELEGVGTLRLEGIASRAATVQCEGKSWRFARRGFWQRVVVATDEQGEIAGEFDPRTFRRGGVLRWQARELVLRPASNWRERYAVAEGERELAILDGKSWGRRPVKVTVEDLDAVEPGLLLFAAFVVRGLAAEADAAAGGASASVSSTGG